jgi:hypothetical protein
MVWQPKIPKFVLNHLVELVNKSICFFNLGFKEAQMKKVADHVLAFVGIDVSPLQVYNHTRKWPEDQVERHKQDQI